MSVVQLCQMRRHGTKCFRVARRWVRVEYANTYNGSKHTQVLGVCNQCANDEHVAEVIGAVERKDVR